MARAFRSVKSQQIRMAKSYCPQFLPVKVELSLLQSNLQAERLITQRLSLRQNNRIQADITLIAALSGLSSAEVTPASEST